MAPWYLATPADAAGSDFEFVCAYRLKWLAVVHTMLPALPPYQALSAAAERGDGLRETDARQIDIDLARSDVEQLQLSEEDTPIHRAALRKLLRAWCVLRPDWGYSQAMNFIAAVMLAVAGHDESTAFNLFVGLIERLPPEFYAEAPPLRGFQVEVQILMTVLEARCGKLLGAADGAAREALPLIACKWFLNLFVDTLPLPSLLAVWDAILVVAPKAPNTSEGAAAGAEAAAPAALGAASDAVEVDAEAMAVRTAPPEVLGAAEVEEGVSVLAASPSGRFATSGPPTEQLLRVSVALLTIYQDEVLHALKQPEADASTAYAALLTLGSDLTPLAVTQAAAAVDLDASLVVALRSSACEQMEAADAAEISVSGSTSWTPATPARAWAQQQVLRLDELFRLKTGLADVARHGSHSSGAWASSGGGSGSDGSGSSDAGGYSGGGGVEREAFITVLVSEAPALKEVGLRVYDVLCMHGGELLPRVPWRELTAALATALRGSLTERLQLVFDLYDPHGTGHIDVPHLMAMSSMLFKLRLLDPNKEDRPLSGRRPRAASRQLPMQSLPPPSPSPLSLPPQRPSRASPHSSRKGTQAIGSPLSNGNGRGREGGDGGKDGGRLTRPRGESAPARAVPAAAAEAAEAAAEEAAAADAAAEAAADAAVQPSSVNLDPDEAARVHALGAQLARRLADGVSSCSELTVTDGASESGRDSATSLLSDDYSVADGRFSSPATPTAANGHLQHHSPPPSSRVARSPLAVDTKDGLRRATEGLPSSRRRSVGIVGVRMCTSHTHARTRTRARARTRARTCRCTWLWAWPCVCTRAPRVHAADPSCAQVRAAPPSVPRLRRVATVCGGDRFELVQQQANEFLQLILVMDVKRSGQLSYAEWVRGVLSLPEVLSCFQLAIAPLRTPAAISTPSNTPGRRRTGGRAGGGSLLPADMPLAAGVSSGLWWRSAWRSLGHVVCGACS